ncbi:MAG: hypothetical protein OEV42_20330 [Deltaproteobacteria bacterium]|nr:hypothetical protein [Deltaproteobacteria bacterium]
MAYIRIEQPCVIPYEPSSLETYLENQLAEKGFPLTSPKLRFEDDDAPEYVCINRTTYKPNKLGHFFSYELRYGLNFKRIFDLNKNVKTLDLANELLLLKDSSQQEIEFEEIVGIVSEEGAKEGFFDLLEYTVKNLGHEVSRNNSCINPQNADNRIFTMKTDYFPFLDLAPFADQLIRLFSSCGYKAN